MPGGTPDPTRGAWRDAGPMTCQVPRAHAPLDATRRLPPVLCTISSEPADELVMSPLQVLVATEASRHGGGAPKRGGIAGGARVQRVILRIRPIHVT